MFCCFVLIMCEFDTFFMQNNGFSLKNVMQYNKVDLTMDLIPETIYMFVE